MRKLGDVAPGVLAARANLLTWDATCSPHVAVQGRSAPSLQTRGVIPVQRLKARSNVLSSA
ncbi:hypothetical protein WA016_02369 [Myxococcus stipitatus]